MSTENKKRKAEEELISVKDDKFNEMEAILFERVAELAETDKKMGQLELDMKAVFEALKKENEQLKAKLVST